MVFEINIVDMHKQTKTLWKYFGYYIHLHLCEFVVKLNCIHLKFVHMLYTKKEIK